MQCWILLLTETTSRKGKVLGSDEGKEFGSKCGKALGSEKRKVLMDK
jgi:hypothetical protein